MANDTDSDSEDQIQPTQQPTNSMPSLPDNPPFMGVAKDHYRYQYLQNAKIIKLLEGLQQLPDLLTQMISKMSTPSVTTQPQQNETFQVLSDLADGAAALTSDANSGNANSAASASRPAPTPASTPETTSSIPAAQSWYFENNLQTTVRNARSNDKSWNRNLKIYRDAFYEQRRNIETAHLYDGWSTENIPYFEKKYAPKIFPSDSEEIKEIKRNQAAVSLQHEISLMQQRGREKGDKMKEVDESMKSSLKEKYDSLVATQLLEKWEKEKEKAKSNATEAWQKRKDYMEKTKAKFQNPSSATPSVDFSDSGESRQNQGRQFPSTPHPSRRNTHSNSRAAARRPDSQQRQPRWQQQRQSRSRSQQRHSQQRQPQQHRQQQHRSRSQQRQSGSQQHRSRSQQHRSRSQQHRSRSQQHQSRSQQRHFRSQQRSSSGPNGRFRSQSSNRGNSSGRRQTPNRSNSSSRQWNRQNGHRPQNHFFQQRRQHKHRQK